jgi:hypothetical protein
MGVKIEGKVGKIGKRMRGLKRLDVRTTKVLSVPTKILFFITT